MSGLAITAQLLNDLFVSIEVDREECPTINVMPEDCRHHCSGVAHTD